jgi:hypothetical protein
MRGEALLLLEEFLTEITLSTGINEYFSFL